MVAWEAKVDTLGAQGKEECEGWVAVLLEKATHKVRDRKGNMRQLDRSVRRMEDIVA